MCQAILPDSLDGGGTSSTRAAAATAASQTIQQAPPTTTASAGQPTPGRIGRDRPKQSGNQQQLTPANGQDLRRITLGA